MQFDIITIFPKIFKNYFNESIIKKAQNRGLLKINIHNLRDFSNDKRKRVDARPFGGEIGMVLKVEPIFKAVSILTKIKKTNKKKKVILFTPRGKKFNQKLAYQFSKLDQLILICGRYEGVDERVAKHITDIELSVGNYDLMGGELPAMLLIETVSRLVPGVLGKPELLKQRITKEKGFIEYPQYTRPEIFETPDNKKWKVPKVLISGNHKKIAEWRKKHQKIIE